MSTVAAAARDLRDRLTRTGLSYRKLQELTGVSDRTIALFVQRGTANSKTLERLETELERIAVPGSAGVGVDHA